MTSSLSGTISYPSRTKKKKKSKFLTSGEKKKVKYFSPTTSTGIIRCSRDTYRIVWCALTLLSEISGNPVVFRVTKVSGTIKKTEREAIRRAKEEIRLVKRLEADAGLV